MKMHELPPSLLRASIIIGLASAIFFGVTTWMFAAKRHEPEIKARQVSSQRTIA